MPIGLGVLVGNRSPAEVVAEMAGRNSEVSDPDARIQATLAVVHIRQASFLVVVHTQVIGQVGDNHNYLVAGRSLAVEAAHHILHTVAGVEVRNCRLEGDRHTAAAARIVESVAAEEADHTGSGTVRLVDCGTADPGTTCFDRMT